jgi:ornithine cyclodeaminase
MWKEKSGSQVKENEKKENLMETKIFNLTQIKEVLKRLDPIQAVENGFAAYSQGKTVIPPVGELLFDDPPGEAHIKYGYIKDEEYFVIKIATGFYENIKSGRELILRLWVRIHRRNTNWIPSFSIKPIL